MNEWRVLVVDDDEDMACAIADELASARCVCDIALSGGAALAACRKTDFDAVVSDVRMVGMDGRELLSRLLRERPGIPVVMLTAEGSIEAAVEAVKQGAFHYLTKPCPGDVLRATVLGAIASRTRESRPPPRNVNTARMENLLGKSEAMSDLRARIELVARAHSPVLVHGETGTGKELVARVIHSASARATAPLVVVNASAIPERAAATHRDLFAEAAGGTLLIEEIGDLPSSLQANVLGVLESHDEVRIIGTTTRRLIELVREGKFREDLFYRLNVVTIVVPPLRKRAADIADLAQHFLERARERAPDSPARTLSPDLVGVLVEAQWPGNVRELESTIERLVVLATHHELTPADLAMQLDEGPVSSSREPSDPSLDGLIQRHVERILERTGGNKALTAKLLGIDLSTLYRWQRKWTT